MSTIFCDIDGTLLEESNSMVKQLDDTKYPDVLEGSSETTKKWKDQGHTIILVTARYEEFREVTVRQLKSYNILYDKLIMGVGSGDRYLINDNGAVGIQVKTNSGISKINIEVIDG
jgi:hydroxymethylpyrimidine pyrophosphatase-like HAD family hydrolase